MSGRCLPLTVVVLLLFAFSICSWAVGVKRTSRMCAMPGHGCRVEACRRQRREPRVVSDGEAPMCDEGRAGLFNKFARPLDFVAPWRLDVRS